MTALFFLFHGQRWFGLLLGWSVFLDEILELLLFDSVDAFSFLFNVFERLHDGFGHFFVGFLRAADDGEVFCTGESFVSVLIIETDAD